MASALPGPLAEENEGGERGQVSDGVISEMEQRYRHDRDKSPRPAPEDPAGAVDAEGDVLNDLEDVLELVPHLEREGEGEQTGGDPSIRARPRPVEAESDVDGREERQVDRVVREVERLDVGEAPEHSVSVPDAEGEALRDLHQVLDLVEALDQDEGKEGGPRRGRGRRAPHEAVRGPRADGHGAGATMVTSPSTISPVKVNFGPKIAWLSGA